MFLFSDARHYHGNPTAFIDDTGRALFEIDDSKSKFKISDQELRKGKREQYTLGQLLDHPELYSNYPHLRDTEVWLHHRTSKADEKKGFTAGYAPMSHESPSASFQRDGLKGLSLNLISRVLPDNIITINGRQGETPTELRARLLHEVQHNIQDHAKALIGPPVKTPVASKGSAAKGLDVDAQMSIFRADVEHMNQELRQKDGGLAFVHPFRTLMRNTIVGRDPFETIDYVNRGTQGEHFNDHYYSGMVRNYQHRAALGKATSFGLSTEAVHYFYDTREIMSRETEARMDFTEEQRLQARPQLAANWPIQRHGIGPPRPHVGPGSKPVKFFNAEERPAAEANLAREVRLVVERKAMSAAQIVAEDKKGASRNFNLLKGRRTSIAALVATAGLAYAINSFASKERPTPKIAETAGNKTEETVTVNLTAPQEVVVSANKPEEAAASPRKPEDIFAKARANLAKPPSGP